MREGKRILIKGEITNPKLIDAILKKAKKEGYEPNYFVQLLLARHLKININKK